MSSPQQLLTWNKYIGVLADAGWAGAGLLLTIVRKQSQAVRLFLRELFLGFVLECEFINMKTL